MNKTKIIVRILALCLAIVLVVPAPAKAAVSETVQPLASDIIATQNAYIYITSTRKVQVWFNIKGLETLDSLGVLWINLFRSHDNTNWTLHKTFSYQNYPDMTKNNASYHDGYVEVLGAPGVYYMASLCFTALLDDASETRYFSTASKQVPVT